MFGKLKDKLKSWIGKVSETKEKTPDISTEEKKKKKEAKKKEKEVVAPIEGHVYVEPEKKVFDKEEREVSDKISKDIEKESKELEKGLKNIEEKEKKSFFKSIFSGKKFISSEDFQEYSEDLEMILLENNVALEVAEKIIYELKRKIVGKTLEKKEIEKLIKKSLKEILLEVLILPFDIIKEIEEKKSPYVILFCGINGTGKTTTIAKFASLLKKKKISSVLGAADTFRAASIEQLKEHGKKIDVGVISHDYGSDPAAVGYDTIQYAKKNKIKAVLIDTAGRMHTAKNLLREMEKIKRVCSPDRVIFLGESITGNDSVDQVKAFDETIGIDGIILSKSDIDEKGGTALSVGYITKKPILFLGTGQKYNDLEKFDKEKFVEKLGLD
ncbi:signal recognition particle-docking protein FtsY [Candidatus Pacearchaeota archaeon]|nr:signal recognition particle-docking protein FtsY [Candidatus Pacearchaeota archaeon]